jgi:hypothetical protein
MAWRHVTFRVVTGNPFGLDKNRYGHNYSMEASLDDDLTTEQLIQILVAEQFINNLDAPYFAFRMIPVHRLSSHASERTSHVTDVIDVNEDILQEQWQDEQEHYRRSPNPPLVPGNRLKEEYSAPVVFVEGVRREFLPYWKQRLPDRGRWGDPIGWCEPLPLSDNELEELKQRFQILSFSSAVEHENALLSESGNRGTPIDPIEIIAILGSIASVAQVILMVAEMWSRKATGKVARKTKQGGTHAWDEVREIRVRMSDGTSVQFEAWLATPENVASFVDAFHLPSQSPKPLWVSFLLKNGTHVRLNVAEGVTNQEELETFISYLKL